MEGGVLDLLTFIIGITNPDPSDHVTREPLKRRIAVEPPATRVQNTINGASLFCSSTLFVCKCCGVDVVDFTGLNFWSNCAIPAGCREYKRKEKEFPGTTIFF